MTAAFLPARMSAALEATTGTVEPSPSPAPESFSPLDVSPGLAGFIPVFLIAVACVLLFMSLTRHLRKVTIRQAEVDAAARREASGGPGGPGGPSGPAGGGPGDGGRPGDGAVPPGGAGGPGGPGGPGPGGSRRP